MPKKLLPPTLKWASLQRIVYDIDWFVDRHSHLDLAAELLLQIFNQLKCLDHMDKRHFGLVVTDRVTGLDMSSPYQNRSSQIYIDVVLELVEERRPKLLQLNLSDVLHLPVRFCHSVLPRLTSLQILNLRSTSCDDGALHIITNCCPLLKELDVSLNDQVTNGGVEILCQRKLIHLQLLDLMWTRVNEWGIRRLIQHLPYLLILRWRNTINVLARIYHDLDSIAERPCLALKQITADRTYLPHSIKGGVYLCLNAVQVIIDGPGLLQAEDLQQLKLLNSLTELYVVLGPSFSSSLRYGDAIDSVLARHGNSMQNLTLGRFEEVDIERIALHCRHLESMVFEQNLNYRWSDGAAKLQPLHSLRKLHIKVRDQDSVSRTRSMQLRDVAPWNLADVVASPQLRELKVTACLTLDDVIFACGGGVSPLLRTVELESCPNVSIDGLWHVLRRSECLSTLKIFRCGSISEMDVDSIRAQSVANCWDLHIDYYKDSDA